MSGARLNLHFREKAITVETEMCGSFFFEHVSVNKCDSDRSNREKF